MMSAAALFGTAALGTLFWLASPEAAVALFAINRPWNPAVIGLIAGGGQAVSLTLLFLFGGQLRQRWRWFDRQCDRVRARLGDRMARGAVVVASVSGLLGFPPASVTATLAPGLAPRPRPLLPLLIATRVVRLSVIAALAATWLRGWWR
jgi:hypothetical protein